MISTREFKRWVATLSDDTEVAIDDGGLTIVELEPCGPHRSQRIPTGAYQELGGIPEPEDDEEE